jgi:histo-blood group ABO system transferase
MYKIGLLLIATNKYTSFLPQLLNGVDRYFFTDHEVTVHIFTDQPLFVIKMLEGNYPRLKIEYFQIPAYKFPYATLYRYKIFTDHAVHLTGDYLIYSDVDMAFVGKVGEEILTPRGLIATQHPGFFMKGGNYYAGGFQGGSRDEYLAAAKIMAEWIEEDEKNNCTKEWHDESNWNLYLQTYGDYKVLTPAYCMVEQIVLRRAWGLSGFRPRILALAKDHKSIRE